MGNNPTQIFCQINTKYILLEEKKYQKQTKIFIVILF